MRVGWIWGLYETQLPFPVHCTKERYHIYTDGKELGKGTASVQHTQKCAREKKGKKWLQRLNTPPPTYPLPQLPPSKGECNFSILMGFFPLNGAAAAFCSRDGADQWHWPLNHVVTVSQQGVMGALPGQSWCLLWLDNFRGQPREHITARLTGATRHCAPISVWHYTGHLRAYILQERRARGYETISACCFCNCNFNFSCCLFFFLLSPRPTLMPHNLILHCWGLFFAIPIFTWTWLHNLLLFCAVKHLIKGKH